MTYNILLTSLYQSGKRAPLRYYYSQNQADRMYCDALFTAEAPTKYLLSTVHIDEIIVLGRSMTYDEGDDEKTLSIADGKSFYHTDINALSTYSLFRYRLAQFRDDLRLDEEVFNNMIPEEDQKQLADLIRQFYESHPEGEENGKFSRFFDRLSIDSDLYDEMIDYIDTKMTGAPGKETLYKKWIDNYLYMNLRDYNKLSILKDNENAKLRFFPTEDTESGSLPIESMVKYAESFGPESNEKVSVYIAMNNDDMTDNFIMLGVMSILDMLNGDEGDIEEVITPTDASYRLSGTIRNNRDGYNLTTAITAVNNFLKYGKADMIADCWEKSGSKNEQVRQMVYAMKRIDTGLTVCSTGDIEKGIASLRALFENGFDLSDCDDSTKLFILMSEGIKKDYGKLVTSEAGFFDLIKWAYEKGFYQPCLTLIESKAPMDIVSRGMLYYCNDESRKDSVTNILARKRLLMKANEQWKMNDIAHYFMKYFFIYKLPSNKIENIRENAKSFVSCIDNTNPETLTGYTVCDDRKLLEDMMFAYYYVGRIRNSTNHAEDTPEENEDMYPDETGVSERLKEISECVQYFIQSYEKVLEAIKDKNPTVVQIDSWDVKRAARRIETEERDKARKAREEASEETQN